MESSNYSSDELIAIRKRIFTILEDTSGRIFTIDEFKEFFFSIFKLHKTGQESYKINHGNMSKNEKNIIRKYFLSPSPDNDFMNWSEIVDSPIAMLIYQGISEYRRDVLPEISRVFEYSERIMKELSTDGIHTDAFFLAIGMKHSMNRFNVHDFTYSNAHFHDVVMPEYKITD